MRFHSEATCRTGSGYFKASELNRRSLLFFPLDVSRWKSPAPGVRRREGIPKRSSSAVRLTDVLGAFMKHGAYADLVFVRIFDSKILQPVFAISYGAVEFHSCLQQLVIEAVDFIGCDI